MGCIRYSVVRAPILQPISICLQIVGCGRVATSQHAAYSCSAVRDIVFGKHSGESLNAQEQRLQSEDSSVWGGMQARIREATLYRFVLHRKAEWQRLLDANAPAAHWAVSFCMKWDETEQVVGHVLQGASRYVIRSPAPPPPPQRKNARCRVATCHIATLQQSPCQTLPAPSPTPLPFILARAILLFTSHNAAPPPTVPLIDSMPSTCSLIFFETC